jgi:hypothetical protein
MPPNSGPHTVPHRPHTLSLVHELGEFRHQAPAKRLSPIRRAPASDACMLRVMESVGLIGTLMIALFLSWMLGG